MKLKLLYFLALFTNIIVAQVSTFNTHSTDPRYLIENDGNLYVRLNAEIRVYNNLTNTSNSVITSSSTGFADGFAVSDGIIYWTNDNSDYVGGYNTNNNSQLFLGSNVLNNPDHIEIINNTDIYVSNDVLGSASGTRELSIYDASTDFWNPVVDIANEELTGMKADGDILYVIGRSGNLYSIDTTDPNYTVSTINNSLGNDTFGIEIVNNFIYYTDRSPGVLKRVSKSITNDAPQIVATGLDIPTDVKLVNEVFYISDRNNNAIYTYNPPCIVNIPDANFKAALVANSTINTNGNTEIECAEASAFTGSITVNSLNIADVTGLEAFINLTEFSCQSNQIAAIDISNNTMLMTLDIAANQLTALDVSQNTDLEFLYCDVNSLTNVDVSQNINLIELGCNFNMLTNLDVSQNIALTGLFCHNNQLNTLDTSQNTLLENFSCFNNGLTTLDVNQNTALQNIFCQDNQLTSLNLSNGNNANLQDVNAINNPSLNCIQIDASFTPPPSPAWLKDTSANYSDDCSTSSCVVTIPDANFKAPLLANTAINTNGNNEIECSEAIAFTGEINVNGLNISDITGIEAFVNTTELDFSNTQVSATNFSFPNSLQRLWAINTNITNLDVSGCSNLNELALNNNAISTIDLSTSVNLARLFFSFSSLTSIDLSNNPNITQLNFFECNLTQLDLSSNSQLLQLNCANNNLSGLNIATGNSNLINFLDATGNPNLSCINIDAGTTPNPGWQEDATASYSDNCASLSNDDFDTVEFKLYPNPTTSVLNIETTVDIKTIEVFSVLGKQVKIFKDTKHLNVSELSVGIYFLKIYNEKGHYEILRFIKQSN